MQHRNDLTCWDKNKVIDKAKRANNSTTLQTHAVGNLHGSTPLFTFSVAKHVQAAVTLSSLSLHPTPFLTHSRQPIMNRYCSVFVFHLSNSTHRFVAGWTPPQLHHKTTLRIVPNQLLNMINLSKKRMVPNQTQSQMRILLQVKLCMRSKSILNTFFYHFSPRHSLPCFSPHNSQ